MLPGTRDSTKFQGIPFDSDVDRLAAHLKFYVTMHMRGQFVTVQPRRLMHRVRERRARAYVISDRTRWRYAVVTA